METIDSQYEDMEELRAILGFEELDESGNKKLFKDLILSGDLIENTWNLISKYKNYFFTLENIKSNRDILSAKSNEIGNQNIKVEKLFDNFSEFLNREDCKNLQFSIIEKSPSTLLDTIYPNLENNSISITPNYLIEFSGIYSTELKNNFSNVKKDNSNQKNDYRNKENKIEGETNENDRNQNYSQHRNKNTDKKKYPNGNYYDKNYEYEEKNKKNNKKIFNKNEYNTRKDSDISENKEKDSKSEKIKNNQEIMKNTTSSNSEIKSNNENTQNRETPRYVKKTVDEMFEENLRFEVEQIEVIQFRKDDKYPNGGRKKTDQNYQDQNYKNYDNKTDSYYGDNYYDYTDYSNGNFYNNKRNHYNSYNGQNIGNNGYNGKYKRYQKFKY